MIVECTSCHTKYNVDDKKIPPAGVKVRCQKCQNVIIIKKEAPAAVPSAVVPPVIPQPPVEPPVVKPPTVTAPPVEPPVTTEPPPVAPPKETFVTEPYMAIPKAAEPPVKPPPTVIEKPTTEAAPLSDEDKRWHERARRLAKALASDLVLYNQDKVEQGLRDGTLSDLLGSEIRRSWEYYCQQIPKHIVQSTDFFKEQLNKIVCKGREIFK